MTYYLKTINHWFILWNKKDVMSNTFPRRHFSIITSHIVFQKITRWP